MTKIRAAFLLSLLFAFQLTAENDYELKGNHFLATYTNCDKEAIQDSSAIEKVMEEAIKKTGATIVPPNRRLDFQPQGTTALFLLTESHASIHTYPEHLACFVDLFTCGDHTDWKPFHEDLKAYFKTDAATYTVLERTHEVKVLESHTAQVN